MKVREAVAAGTTLMTLAACTGGGEHSTASESRPPAHEQLEFLPDGHDSDIYKAINCQQNPRRAAAIALPAPNASRASVLITLGLSHETPDASQHTVTAHLLGGVTIKAIEGKYLLAYSDGLHTTVKPPPEELAYVRSMKVGNTTVTVLIGTGLAGSTDQIETAYIECEPPKGLPHSTPTLFA